MDIKDLTWNEISSRRFNNPLFPKKHSWNISRKIGMWEDDSAIEFSLKTQMAR